MILSESYNRDSFIEFIQNFLPDFEKDVRGVSLTGSKDIGEASFLGKSESLGKLRVFEFRIAGSANKRISLTKDAFSIMKETSTSNALAVFYSDSDKQWRFSLLTSNYEIDKKGGVKVEFSNPRRFSFLLGPDAKVNTPHQFLVKKGEVKDLDDLKSRFSLEVVNKEFYSRIVDSFFNLVGGTIGEGSKKKVFNAKLKLPGVSKDSQELREFTVRLIGRIIFCWFLREKKSDKGIPLMPRELLSLNAVQSTKNYYHTVLEPVFFEVLNREKENRIEEFRNEFYDLVPYLNGGLFTPQGDDYYKRLSKDLQSQFHNTLVIPDEWLETFFSVLEEYHFTIDENTSFDEDLSIDPEMLGRIFENLLAEINPETEKSARKETGSYYTPRTIVEYMIDESLYYYLENKTGIEEKKLRASISYDLNDDLEAPLTDSEKEKIVDALGTVKILDPTCGSGAFPMGALQKLVFILSQVDPKGELWFKRQIASVPPEVKRLIEKEFKEKNFDWLRKIGLIKNNIYGVDIQSIATEISRLRCFLTLVVDDSVRDEESNRGVDPLPNLDFKFVTANSLIGLPKRVQNSLFGDEDGIKELRELRSQYFGSYGQERLELKDRFKDVQNEMLERMVQIGESDDLTQSLATWKPFQHRKTDWFDPEWMFGISEGFDVVIGNPPYVQLQKDAGKLANLYSKQGYKTFERTGDIYCLFYERGNQLLGENGILTFITSNKWMRAGYGKSLRKYLSENTTPKLLIDLGPGVFETATVDTNILAFEYGKKDFNCIACSIKENLEKANIPLSRYIEQNSVKLQTLSEDAWIILSPIEQRIKEKIEKVGTPLKDWDVNIYRGVLTGYNEAFIIDGAKKDELIKKDPKSAEIIKPILRGRDIKRYYTDFADKWLIATHNGYTDANGVKVPRINIGDYPVVKEWLDENWEAIEKRQDRGNTPYNLRNCAYQEKFEKEKIIYNDITRRLSFALSKPGEYFNNTVYFIADNEKLRYLIAVLNTRIVDWYYKQISAQLGEKAVRMFSIYFENLPIPKGMNTTSLELKVNKILSITSQKNYDSNNPPQEQLDLEAEIDRMVYELYGLTPEEIKVVEGSV